MEIAVDVREWMGTTAGNAWNSTEEARVWIGEKANEAWNSATETVTIAGTWIGDNAMDAWGKITDASDATGEWICDTAGDIQVVSAEALDSAGQWIDETGKELVYFTTSTGEVVAAYVEDIDKEEVVDYLARSGEKLVLGEYSEEDPTLLSIGGTLAASVVNLDIGMDIRDIVYDVQHLDSGEVEISDIALSAVGLIPIIGVIKPAKKFLDAADAVTTMAKVADDAVDVAKAADAVSDVSKVAEAVSDAGKIAEAVSDTGKMAEAVNDTGKTAEAISDVGKTVEIVSDAEKTVDNVSDVNKASDAMNNFNKSSDDLVDTTKVAEQIPQEVSEKSIEGIADAGVGKVDREVSEINIEKATKEISEETAEKAVKDIADEGIEHIDYYTSEMDRINQTPKKGFAGPRGNSKCYPDTETEAGKRAAAKMAEYGQDSVKYENGVIDFSPFSESTVHINMTSNRETNFKNADKACAQKWNDEMREGRVDWTGDEVKEWRKENNFTWHERSDMKRCDLISRDIHTSEVFSHSGGIAEFNKKEKIDLEGMFDE